MHEAVGTAIVARPPRAKPQPVQDFENDLAVEISFVMRRRKLRYVDVAKTLGNSRSRARSISRFLKGEEHDLGIRNLCRLAESLSIPVRVLVGDEAREVA